MSISEPTLGERIKQKREALGMTQNELSELIGLGPSGGRTIRGWEKDEHTPSDSKLKAILAMGDHIPFRPSPRRRTSFSFIDLFAGIGGIRLPFQELGGKCVFTSEWDKFAKKTYAANYGEVPAGDITKIAVSDIPAHDVLLAGFPCQAFSQAGLKKGFMDTRGTMFFEIHRILAYHRPKAILLENVKQLRGHDNGRTLAIILSILRGETGADVPDDVLLSPETRESLKHRLNYSVDFRVLKARDFGLPQNRERLYIVGFDRDYYGDTDVGEILDRIKKFGKPTRLGDVLENNASLDPKHTLSDALMLGHERRQQSHRARGNGFGYSIFNTESPYCNTLMARYYKDGREILIDQFDIGKNPRKLTPRECARIQGFPDEFRVDAVSNTQTYKQFGNSVSVPVIREIANSMVQFMNDFESLVGDDMAQAG